MAAMSTTQTLSPHLPALRRYARALTGSRSSGDAYVRAVLTAVLAGEGALREDLPARIGLYALFHRIWLSTATRNRDRPAVAAYALPGISEVERAALLLTGMEAFSLKQTAAILGLPVWQIEHDLERSLVFAQRSAH
jgi:DNA-directed RNA polymerase specialized sigma24 family protein